VALLGGQPRNPELLAQIAARDRADQEAVAAVGQFAAGAALVNASLDSLQRTFAALSRAVVHCQDLSPVGPDLLQAAVEQIGADVEAAKAMLDTGSKLLTAVEPANPTQADLLAKGRRDIEAAQRLFYRIQPFVQMIRAMAAGHKGTRTGMPHTMIGPPCDAAGILTMLQECVLEAVTLVQVGLGMQEAATRLTTSVTVAELEFPAVPEGQGEARPEILSAAAFPQVPSPTSSPVRTDVPKVQAVVPEKEKALSHQWLTV
jgi:hypothetical protein